MSTKKDSAQEYMLTNLGASWKYSNKVLMSQLCEDWDIENAGRPREQLKHEDIVLSYAARTEGGSSAPAPILRVLPYGLEVLDGVRRLCALRLLGISQFSAYLVDTDSDALASTIRVLGNFLIHGQQEDVKWTKRQAVQLLVIDGDITVEQLATTSGWKIKDLRGLADRLRCGFQIRCAGGPEMLADGIIDNIIASSEPEDFDQGSKPIASFCHDLKKGKFSNGDSAPFVKAFFSIDRKKGKIHDQLTKQLTTFRANPEVTTRLSGRPPNRLRGETKVIRALKACLSSIKDVENKKELMFHMEEAYVIVRQMRQHLEAIHKYSKQKA